jgi:hypothetical protein
MAGRGQARVGARLALACRNARLDADVRALEVALSAGVVESTISRFESGLWPHDPERIVAAYERECGLPDLELWRRAICR